MKDTRSRRALLIPLIALAVSWSIFMVALYTDLFVTPIYDDNGVWIGQDPAVRISPYLFFLAVAVFATAAVIAQRIAIKQRLSLGHDERLPRSVHRFATLSIVIALGVGAVLGIRVFLEGFNTYGPRSDDLGLRLLTTYLPIVLYTALVVAVLLVGFVFRKDSLPKSDDKALEGEEHSADHQREGQRSLGAAYAVPIIAVAVALIFGLIVFDVTGTNLEVWVWVIIQVMIGAGIVAGTIFGEQAVQSGPAGSNSRSRITRGARGLNFVLSVVFGAVVSLMGFGFGSSAVESLRVSPSFYVEITPMGPGAKIQDMQISASGRDLAEDSNVSVILESPEQALLSGNADHRGDFYQTAPLPEDLEPGEYTLKGSATSADGTPLSRTLEFSLSDDGEIEWDYVGDAYKYEMQESSVLEPNGAWFIDDLLPALVLILLAQAGIFLSLTERNKRRLAQVTQE